MKLWHIAILLLVLALFLFWLASRKRKQSGLPAGNLLYADTDQLQRLPKPLYDPALRLVGKPDYILKQTDGSLIPVEYKSMPAPAKPYDSHVFQVLAYCYLAEESFKMPSPYGLIRYQDESFEISFDDESRQALFSLLETMRELETDPNAPARSHCYASRCKSCGFADMCDQSLS